MEAVHNSLHGALVGLRRPVGRCAHDGGHGGTKVDDKAAALVVGLVERCLEREAVGPAAINIGFLETVRYPVLAGGREPVDVAFGLLVIERTFEGVDLNHDQTVKIGVQVEERFRPFFSDCVLLPCLGVVDGDARPFDALGERRGGSGKQGSDYERKPNEGDRCRGDYERDVGFGPIGPWDFLGRSFAFWKRRNKVLSRRFCRIRFRRALRIGLDSLIGHLDGFADRPLVFFHGCSLNAGRRGRIQSESFLSSSSYTRSA